MLINWFTVIAQIANFLILVWLLKRFLYKPILKAVDDREKLIASQITSAEQKEADALKEKNEFKEKNEEFERNKASLMNAAHTEANVERQRLLEAARNEAKEMQQKFLLELEDNKQHISNEIIKKIQREVIALSEKTLKDIANQNIEEQTIQLFINRLKDVAAKNQITLNEAIQINTAFELQQNQKEKIRQAIYDDFKYNGDISFSMNPSLILGVEMISGGYKMAWSVSDYFSSLQKEMETVFESKTKTLA